MARKRKFAFGARNLGSPGPGPSAKFSGAALSLPSENNGGMLKTIFERCGSRLARMSRDTSNSNTVLVDLLTTLTLPGAAEKVGFETEVTAWGSIVGKCMYDVQSSWMIYSTCTSENGIDQSIKRLS